MVKFRNGALQVKFLDTSIIVSKNKRNVFNLLYTEDTETLKELEKSIKECKNSFKFKMSYIDKKDILKKVMQV